jgi:DNA-3-methyladenine glycosylase
VVLPLSFFESNALIVARDLVGQTLVVNGLRLRILETEAYSGLDDKASHGRVRTARSEPLYGPPGRVWIYRSRGLHWMLNLVAEPEGQPAAVLIRALESAGGSDLRLRGPGLLTKSLGIDQRHQGLDATRVDSPIHVETSDPLPDHLVANGPRVGMGKAPEPWFSAPRRWWVAGHPGVSSWRK